MFGIIFILAGLLSEIARKNDWPNRSPLNLFENTYRMGSLVFGGGQVLMPMMYEQFSVRPDAVKVKDPEVIRIDRKSTRLNSSHGYISYAVFCLKKKKKHIKYEKHS